MANYTDDEIQTAVEKIVRSTVRHPTGSLGERQVSTSFNDLQEAAIGVYILYFNAPYYTLLLGVRRLLDTLQTQASTVSSLIDAALALKRLVMPIDDISSLANAKAALEELQGAVSARSQGFTDIKQVPAFRRYAQSISNFLESYGGNIKGVPNPSNMGADDPTSSSSTSSSTSTVPAVGTTTSNPSFNPTAPFAITDTPAGARSKIPGLVSQVAQLQAELVRRVDLIARALEDFEKLNLPQLAAQGVISRSQQVLADHYDSLSALDENSRLENLRGLVLDLLTQSPLVEKYGAGQAPSEFIATQGMARAYSDAFHPVTPAQLTAMVAGPYYLTTENHILQLSVDGGASFTYPLPIGFVAEINGAASEPFKVDTDSNVLSLQFGDTSGVMETFNIPLTIGSGSRTASQIAADVSAALAGTDLVMEEYFRVLKLDTLVIGEGMVGNTAKFTAINAGGFKGLNIQVGDEVEVLSGVNDGTTWAVAAIDVAGNFIATAGSTPFVDDPETAIQVGDPAKGLRLRDTNDNVSLTLRRTIRLLATGKSALTSTYLGFAPGISARSAPVLARDLAQNITNSTNLFTATYTDTVINSYSAASTADPTVVSLAEQSVEGTLMGDGTERAYFTSNEELPIGSKLVITACADQFLVGAMGARVGDLSDDGKSAFYSFDRTFDVGEIDVSADLGPSIVASYGAFFTIEDGPNQGRFIVTERHTDNNDFLLQLDRPLPVPLKGGSPVRFTYSLGISYVTFGSPSNQTDSAIIVESSPAALAGVLFFGVPELPDAAVGTTRYLQFDTFPKGASVGDLVQMFENQYNTVSREFSILSVDQGLRVLELNESTIPSDSLATSFSITFDQGVANPFGAIRIAQTANYSVMKQLLNDWLLSPELSTGFFRDLARYLNPVLTTSNPKASDVDTAVDQLKRLSAVLSIVGATAWQADTTETLEAALRLYSSPVEPAVDALITTFRNKGADRAIDLLLEGQFSQFFGLDLNTVSYSGALTQSARDVAMNDLPIRKLNRRNSYGQQLIGTIPNQPDYEHDQSDAEGATPDPPGAPDVSGPGDSF